MNGPSWQRFAPFRIPSVIGGMALAAFLLAGPAVQQGSAAPALVGASATANFEIFADELEQERITLPEPGGSGHVLPPAPQSIAGSNDATASGSDRSNVDAQMMDLAVQQTVVSDDNVWMALYQTLAYDHVQ